MILVMRLLCGILGHDQVLHFEDQRVLLKCMSCHHESSGWDVGGRRPVRRFQGDAKRHVLVRQAVPARKSA